MAGIVCQALPDAREHVSVQISAGALRGNAALGDAMLGGKHHDVDVRRQPRPPWYRLGAVDDTKARGVSSTASVYVGKSRIRHH